MGKRTNNQKSSDMQSVARSDEAKRLLEGIIDLNIVSNVALITSHAGPLMILGVTYPEFCKTMSEWDMSSEAQSEFIEVETFQWTGQRHSEAITHKKIIRVGWIIEVIEVTREQWDMHVTEQIARQTQSMN